MTVLPTCLSQQLTTAKRCESRWPASRSLVLSLMLAIVIVPAEALVAQVKATPAVPDHVLYEAFFRNVAGVEDQAQKLEQKGHQGASLRKAVCTGIGFDSLDCTVFFARLTVLTKKLQGLDDAAHAISENERKRVKETGALLAPMPPQLKQLQEQREAAIKESMQDLDSRLTLAGGKKIKTFVTSRSGKVTPHNTAPQTR